MKLDWHQRWYLLTRAFQGMLDAKPGSVGEQIFKGLWPSRGGEPAKRGVQQHLQAYGTMPWVRGVFSKIASAIASTTWQLYVPTTERGVPIERQQLGRLWGPERKTALGALRMAGQLKPIEQHIFLDALQVGNLAFSGHALLKFSSTHLDLVGECFWLKERNAFGKPVAFWPVPAHWIVDTPTVTHRAYRVSFRGWQGEIPDSEVIWIRDADQENPYGRGTGFAQALADELETDEYAAKHVKSFFFNGAKPDFLVYPKGGTSIDTDNARRLEEKWLSKHQGFWRKFKPHFLTQEVGVHEFQQNFQHLQLTQLREHARNVIMQVVGMPPEVMGVIENSNRATIDGAFYLFASQLVVPRLELWRSELQHKVLGEYDPRLILDYASPIPEDQEFKLKAYQAAPHAPQTDEWRALQGLPPLAQGGKLHAVPINVTFQETLAEPEPMSLPAAGSNPLIPDAEGVGMEEGA